MIMKEVSREEIPDLPDRVIAAAALLLRVPVLSRDGRIRSSSVAAIFGVDPKSAGSIQMESGFGH